MWQSGDVKQITCDAGYITANFDGTGLGINKRKGWAICNGSNGTYDMGGKFPVGYKDADADYGVMGNTGGAKTVTLTAAQQGKLNARAMVDDISGGGTSAIAKLELGGIEVPRDGASNQAGWGSSIQAPLNDALTAHENRPPYKTLLFIQKL
jgi:hypothetical protein